MVQNPFAKKSLPEKMTSKVEGALKLKKKQNSFTLAQQALLYFALFLAGFMAAKIHSLITFGG